MGLCRRSVGGAHSRPATDRVDARAQVRDGGVLESGITFIVRVASVTPVVIHLVIA